MSNSSIELEYIMSVSNILERGRARKMARMKALRREASVSLRGDDILDKDVYNSETGNKVSSQFDYVGGYKVTRIVDSINYKPGEILDEEEVKTLCNGSPFTVTIK